MTTRVPGEQGAVSPPPASPVLALTGSVVHEQPWESWQDSPRSRAEEPGPPSFRNLPPAMWRPGPERGHLSYLPCSSTTPLTLPSSAWALSPRSPQWAPHAQVWDRRGAISRRDNCSVLDFPLDLLPWVGARAAVRGAW